MSVPCNDVFRALFYQNGTNILSTVLGTRDDSYVLQLFKKCIINKEIIICFVQNRSFVPFIDVDRVLFYLNGTNILSTVLGTNDVSHLVQFFFKYILKKFK